MKLFTDASITHDTEGEVLFTSHSVVVCNDNYEVQDIETFTVRGLKSINEAEMKSILRAIELGEKHSTIYTDSMYALEKPSKKLNRRLEDGVLNLEWLSRDYNGVADLACSLERHEELDRLSKKNLYKLPVYKKPPIELNQRYKDKWLEKLTNGYLKPKYVEEVRNCHLTKEKILTLLDEYNLKSLKEYPAEDKDGRDLVSSLDEVEMHSFYLRYAGGVLRSKAVSEEMFKEDIKKYQWTGVKTGRSLRLLALVYALHHHNVKDLYLEFYKVEKKQWEEVEPIVTDSVVGSVYVKNGVQKYRKKFNILENDNLRDKYKKLG